MARIVDPVVYAVLLVVSALFFWVLHDVPRATYFLLGAVLTRLIMADRERA